ncbi:MAG: Gfo/Idh/MocA family oxidoreductase [Kiritimatiellae bacterium]|nr:Gfo/Idh/MocA family oxidoreductase [Kiritimatiellia bacterium]
MHIGFSGRLEDRPEIRAGFIGCGGHSFRNIYPTFQFTPVDLVATCDLDLDKAKAFAAQFGAAHAYADYREMIEKEQLDAVFVVTNLDKNLRPFYSKFAIDCLNAGLHVWMEKPAAVTCAEVEEMQAAARENGKIGMVGLKRMFVPAAEKAKALMDRPEFGPCSLVTLTTTKYVPEPSAIAEYVAGKPNRDKAGELLGHFWHPISSLLFFLGMPKTLSYERSRSGGALATFTFESGAIASVVFAWQASNNGGIERIMIHSGQSRRHIMIDNNIRLTYHRGGEPGRFGVEPSFFVEDLDHSIAVWEPEFSLGNLYNKGLFLMGFWGEVQEFATAILENRQPRKAGFDHAWQCARIFEAFAEGTGKAIALDVNA